MKKYICAALIAIVTVPFAGAPVALSKVSGSLSGNGASNVDSRRNSRVHYRFGRPTSNRPRISGSLSSVGASNIDSRRGQRIRHRYGKPAANKPQARGSLSQTGASNIDAR